MAGQEHDDHDRPGSGGPFHPESLLIVLIVVITAISAMLRLFG